MSSDGIMDFTMCSYFCMKMEDCNAFRITDEDICITYHLTDTNIASCLKIGNDFVELWMKKSELVETTCTKPWGKSKEKKLCIQFISNKHIFFYLHITNIS